MYKIFALLAVAGMMMFGASTVEAARPHRSRPHISFGNHHRSHIDIHRHRSGSFGIHINPGHRYHHYYQPRYRHYYQPRYRYYQPRYHHNYRHRSSGFRRSIRMGGSRR